MSSWPCIEAHLFLPKMIPFKGCLVGNALKFTHSFCKVLLSFGGSRFQSLACLKHSIFILSSVSSDHYLFHFPHHQYMWIQFSRYFNDLRIPPAMGISGMSVYCIEYEQFDRQGTFTINSLIVYLLFSNEDQLENVSLWLQ